MGFQPFLYLLWKNRVTWDANHSCIYYRRTELRIFLIGTILHLSASVLVPVWRRHHLLLSPLLCEKCVKTSPAYIPTPWEECVKTSPASVPTSMWRMLEDITCFCPHPHVKNVWRHHLLLSPPPCEECVKISPASVPTPCEECVMTSPAYIPTPWEKCVKTSPAYIPTPWEECVKTSS
jgi:hypothetical protein